MVGKKKVKPEQDAIEHVLMDKDKDFIEGRNISAFKGRGVIALEHIEPSTFIVEYRGILSQCKHAEDIHRGDFLFNFTWNGGHYCIDASEEDGTLGRLVNDDHRNPNCKVKTIIVEGKPHLCLFSIRDIFPGEEITYSYGDFSCPWRTMELYDKTSVAECSVNPFTPGREKQDGELSSFDEASSDEDLYADKFTEEYSDYLDFRQNTDSDDSLSINTWKPPYYMTSAAVSESSKSREKNMAEPSHCSPVEQDTVSDKSSSANDDHDTNTKNTKRLRSYKSSDKQAAVNVVPNPKDTFTTHKNYCYVCKKPQSKIARHLKKHQDSEAEIAAAFSLPKHSKERKRLLEKLRNRGNYQHNQEVMDNKSGPLKVRRRPVRSEIKLSAKTYVHCVYCKGMFIRKELWRHLRRCHSKNVSETAETAGKARVLVLADTAESTFSQAISPEVWRILGKMKNDDISSVVRNDFLILQMSQCLYNKHGSDPAKSDYIRQQVRDVGRLLLSLRQKYSIFNFEDAVRQDNFNKVIQAVKEVAGYDEKRRSCKTAGLMMKLEQSLHKIADIILCRAIAMENDDLIKATERFKRLCSSEWTEKFSNASLDSLSESYFNKSSTITFTQDVQRLQQHLEKRSVDAFKNLKNHQSSQTYTELAEVTLAQVVIFNRCPAGEISRMTLECFKNRDGKDKAVGLSPFEQRLSKRFSRVEIIDKKGRNVSILLNPELISAIQLLVDKRHACDVDRDNPYVFGRPLCSSSGFFSVQDCMRMFVSQCGAQNPEHLQATPLRKHVATISQILHLKDNELDQLATFLALDIQIHRDYYRLPDAAAEIAEISKVVLAMERGSSASVQGKSLDDVGIEAENDLELDKEEISDDDDDDEESDPSIRLRGKRKKPTDEASSSTKGVSRRGVKRPWSTNEVNAVMKHFKSHIYKAKLATSAECERCKIAEDPVLKERTVQNIRDFVRNRGVMLKKQHS